MRAIAGDSWWFPALQGGPSSLREGALPRWLVGTASAEYYPQRIADGMLPKVEKWLLQASARPGRQFCLVDDMNCATRLAIEPA